MDPVTRLNLESAFAGEALEVMMYWLFEKQAEAEGLDEVAELFERIGKEEQEVHARKIGRLLGMPRHTRDNLEMALRGEFTEHRRLFPRAAGLALETGDLAESLEFQDLGADEHRHADALRAALRRLDADVDEGTATASDGHVGQGRTSDDETCR